MPKQIICAQKGSNTKDRRSFPKRPQRDTKEGAGDNATNAKLLSGEKLEKIKAGKVRKILSGRSPTQGGGGVLQWVLQKPEKKKKKKQRTEALRDSQASIRRGRESRNHKRASSTSLMQSPWENPPQMPLKYGSGTCRNCRKERGKTEGELIHFIARAGRSFHA